jgi:NAD(P)-dependent dehydrogenase (short-subunit alcohol dehydrogenase family)
VDLSTVDGSRRLAAEVERLCEEQPDLQLTVLMNNAGVFSEEHVVTDDGLELTFAVNVVAPFVVTSHLLPILLKQPKSKIVIASSISQCRDVRDWNDLAYAKRRYSAHAAYSESKLLDAMLTMEMAERLQKADLGTDRITCNCLDPGTVNTKMLLAGWGPCGIAVEDALDQTWLCQDPEVERDTGRYYVYKSERRASASAYDASERDKMWDILSEIAPDAAAMWKFDWL